MAHPVPSSLQFTARCGSYTHSAIMYLRGGRAKFWGEEERVAFSSSSKNGRNGRLDCARLLSPSHSPSVLVIEAGLTPSRFSPLREMPRMLSVFRFCVPALQPPPPPQRKSLKSPCQIRRKSLAGGHLIKRADHHAPQRLCKKTLGKDAPIPPPPSPDPCYQKCPPFKIVGGKEEQKRWFGGKWCLPNVAYFSLPIVELGRRWRRKPLRSSK